MKRLCLFFICFILYKCNDAMVFPSYLVDRKENILGNGLMDKLHKDAPNINSLPNSEEHIYQDYVTDRQKTLRNKIIVEKYVEHLKMKGKLKILAEAKHIERQVKIKNNITNIIEISTNKFSSLLQRYYEDLLKDKSLVNDVDREFIILGLIDTANEIIYEANKDVLSEFIKQRNTDLIIAKNKITDEKYKVLKHDIYERVVDNKKEDRNYICESLDICRTFPAYSDFMADVLKEILKSPDARFNYFVTNLVVLVKEQSNFIKTVLGEKLIIKIGDNVEEVFYGEISKVRYFFSALRRLLIERHKLAISKGKEINIRPKAIGILIDIVDKAFDNEDETTVIYFDNTLHTLRNWSNMGDDSISRLMGNIIRHFFHTLKYKWKRYVKEEVKTIANVILRGKVINKNVFKYLFSKGSKYVNLKREFNIDF